MFWLSYQKNMLERMEITFKKLNNQLLPFSVSIIRAPEKTHKDSNLTPPTLSFILVRNKNVLELPIDRCFEIYEKSLKTFNICYSYRFGGLSRKNTFFFSGICWRFWKCPPSLKVFKTSLRMYREPLDDCFLITLKPVILWGNF